MIESLCRVKGRTVREQNMRDDRELSGEERPQIAQVRTAARSLTPPIVATRDEHAGWAMKGMDEPSDSPPVNT
ncbi:hypothetical protein ACWEPN_39945, partial [Nonomuraea wenchangensis]